MPLDLSSVYVFSALAAAVAGLIMSKVNAAPQRVGEGLKRLCVVKVDIMSGDPLYDWLRNWLHTYSKGKRVATISAATKRQETGDSGDHNSGAPQRPTLPELIFFPGYGVHLIRHKRHWIVLNRSREDKNPGTNEYAASFLPTRLAWFPL